MKISRRLLFALAIILIVGLTWFVTSKFWFDNYDLAYMNQYLNINNFPAGLNLKEVVRGHELVELLLYPFFNINPAGYYLVTNFLHALAAVVLFFFFLNFSKNIKLSFLSALLFGVSVVYSNTLFEGVFNSYYPALLLIISACVLPFLFVDSGILKPRRLILVTLLMVLGFAFRETALIIPFLILLALILTSKNLKDLKRKIFYFLVPLAIAILYLIFRQKVLGVLQSDLSDDAVQARMAYVASGRWFELFTSIAVNFLRLSAEQIFSYPLLYWVRDKVALLVLGGNSGQNFAVYFAAVAGALAWALIIKSKKLLKNGGALVYRLWLFGLGWFVMFNLFTATAVPFPAHVLSQVYNYTTVLSRYNYFAYFGLTIAFFSVLLSVKKGKFWIFALVVIWLIYNFLAIQLSGKLLYDNYHVQAKDFYQKLSGKVFPKNTYLYYNFFRVNNLRDRMWELVYVFGKRSSPATTFTFESTLAGTQKEYLSGKAKLDDIFAYDLDERGFLVDKTQTVRRVLSGLKPVDLLKTQNENEFNVPGHVLANLKYDLEFEARAIGVDPAAKEALCSGKSIEVDPGATPDLLSYLQKRKEFLGSVKIEVSGSRSIYSIFPYYGEDELIDNQFGPESSWMPDSFLGGQWVTLDLGQQKSINGFAWMSDGKNGNPQSYELFKSNDNLNWQRVLTVSSNSQPSRLDLFPRTESRYLKMVIHSTQLGQPVNLREVEAMDYPQSFDQSYREWGQLVDDAYNVYCFVPASGGAGFEFGKVTWETSQKTLGEKNIIFDRNSNWKSYNTTIVNWEPYSQSVRLMDDEYLKIGFLTGQSGLKYEIRNVKLVPSKN